MKDGEANDLSPRKREPPTLDGNQKGDRLVRAHQPGTRVLARA
jgi:hypothetical protein